MADSWKNKPDDHLLKVYRIIAILGSTRHQVYGLIAAGDLPACQINGLYYVSIGDLRRFLRSKQVKGVQNVR